MFRAIINNREKQNDLGIVLQSKADRIFHRLYVNGQMFFSVVLTAFVLGIIYVLTIYKVKNIPVDKIHTVIRKRVS